MKKIFLLLAVFTFAFGQTRTSVWSLPQWGTGDTLKAGAKNTTSLSNYSLNNAFARIDSIGGVQIDSSGLFRSVRGRGTGNLTIDAGVATATPQRIVLNDSLYGAYNWQTTANLLVGGNVTIGGYMSTDSLMGNIISDTIGSRAIYASGNISSDGDISALGSIYGYTGASVGSGNVSDGYIDFQSGLHFNRPIRLQVAPNVLTSSKTIYLPDKNGTIALLSNNDSLQAPTVHAVLFNSEKVAGTSLNDTSALFSEWTSNTTTEYPIVRLKYLHKAGITNVVARYYAYVGAGDFWESNVTVGSLASSTSSGSNSSYGSMSTTTVNVSGLTANTLYTLTFNVGINSSGTSHFKELVITAESN